MKYNKEQKKAMTPYIIVSVFIVFLLLFSHFFNNKVNVLTYDEFEISIKEGLVKEITITPRGNAKIYEITGKMKDYSEKESFTTKAPLSDAVINKIFENDKDIKIETKSDPESGTFLNLIFNFLPLLLLVGVTFYFFNKQMGNAGGNKSFDFGKSKAKLNQDSAKTTFKKVAGLDEEKEEVGELIEFLKNPKKFQKMGARIPKGVLLVGPPGTGKTLLAKAIAGEADVPFYFISGSDFVELFVGIGASRVRDMFKEAKQTAPCLIFIDEIDAVGRQRGTGLGGGHDEREQTLNQLLTEMDGFGANEGIIIIAATNRPDVLDPALLRPGRFDRQIVVNFPDVKGREEILEVHAKNKTLAPSVKLKNIAKRTSGFTGADLENLLNEAALLTVRRNKPAITMSEIDEATDRVLMGPAKKSRKYTERDKEITAYHEAGHVVLGLKLSEANIVQKVTIIPRGYAGGYTMMGPKEERFTMTKNELLDRISGLLGGRVAEEIMFKEITTGAQDDLSKATKIARAMVTEYGMSDLGLLHLEQSNEGVFLGRDYTKSSSISNEIAHEIDKEMRKIINHCHETATKLMKTNKKLLDLIAKTLIEKETLTKEEIDHLVEHGSLEGYEGKEDK